MTGSGAGSPAGVATEATDPRYTGLEELSVADMAALMNAADAEVPVAVERALPQITAAIEGIVDRMRTGGRLVYVGAGTSGRLGVLDASELPPAFGVSSDHVSAIIAGGPGAIVDAVEGAEDDAEAGAFEVGRAGVGAGDVVVGLASSGRTPFVLGAVRAARDRGALTVGLSCNEDTELSRAVDHPIEVVVGPEVLSGSTRLKAGTAQKLVLNMISTITMVRLGRTYRGLMVDVRPTSAKLRDRAARIVAMLTEVAPEEATAMLADSGYDVKTAVLRLRLGVGVEAATARLVAAGGSLGRALDGQSDGNPEDGA